MISHVQGRPTGPDTPGRPAPTGTSNTEPIGDGPVNGFETLTKLSVLPVSTWRYRWEPAGVRHLGPMAQDWHAAFELGRGDTTIPLVDAHGVLLVAIQALYRELGELRAGVDQLHQQLAQRPPHQDASFDKPVT